MTARKRAKAKASAATRDAKAIAAQEIAEKATEAPETAEKPVAGFPIVGIGASAGVTAFVEFCKRLILWLK